MVQAQSRGALCQNFADGLRSLSRLHGAVGKRATSPTHGLSWRPTNFCACVRLLEWATTFVPALRRRLVDPSSYTSSIFSICLLYCPSIGISAHHSSEHISLLPLLSAIYARLHASARSLLCRCQRSTRRRSRKIYTTACPSCPRSSTSDDCSMRCHSHDLADVEGHWRSRLYQVDHAILCDLTRLFPHARNGESEFTVSPSHLQNSLSTPLLGLMRLSKHPLLGLI